MLQLFRNVMLLAELTDSIAQQPTLTLTLTLPAFTKKHRLVMWPNNINALQWINHVEMVLGSYITIQVNIQCCLTAMKPLPPNKTPLVGEFSGHHQMSVKFHVWLQKKQCFM